MLTAEIIDTHCHDDERMLLLIRQNIETIQLNVLLYIIDKCSQKVADFTMANYKHEIWITHHRDFYDNKKYIITEHLFNREITCDQLERLVRGVPPTKSFGNDPFEGFIPLSYYAIVRYDTHLLQLLIECGSNINGDLLNFAIKKGFNSFNDTVMHVFIPMLIDAEIDFNPQQIQDHPLVVLMHQIRSYINQIDILQTYAKLINSLIENSTNIEPVFRYDLGLGTTIADMLLRADIITQEALDARI